MEESSRLNDSSSTGVVLFICVTWCFLVVMMVDGKDSGMGVDVLFDGYDTGLLGDFFLLLEVYGVCDGLGVKGIETAWFAS
ncbi:hypothetical protein G6F42_014519 [Rhizopus arrhizus]|nr:hypothetical protein G6F42_014519 [Rhizopus arrhizus]